MKLEVVSDGVYLAPSDRSIESSLALPAVPEIEAELDAMISDIRGLTFDLPDEILRTCAGFQARCTQLYVNIIRVEGRERRLQFLRTQQLVKVMELIDFTYKAASRTVEIRRQEVELSR